MRFSDPNIPRHYADDCPGHEGQRLVKRIDYRAARYRPACLGSYYADPLAQQPASVHYDPQSRFTVDSGDLIIEDPWKQKDEGWIARYRSLSLQFPNGTPEERLPDELRCGYCGTRLWLPSEWQRGFCCEAHERGEPRA